MKKKYLLLRIFWLLILFITISESYSQIPVSPGHVILANHDTIYGKIENSQFGSVNRCVLIKNGTSNIQILNPEQVIGFFISPDSHFQSQQIDGKKTFLKIISEGKINLYMGNMSLYISCNSDGPIRLERDKEYYTKNGITYLKEHNTYITSIKNCVSDTSYYQKIEKIPFDNRAITKLIKDINDQDSIPLRKPEGKIYHRNQYGLDFGYSINTFIIQNIYYNNDSLFVSYPNDPKHVLNAWQIGFSYKRNLKSTNFYLYGGIKYNKMQKTSIERQGLIFSTLVFPSQGNSYLEDSVGYIKEQYHYDMTQVSIPVSIYEEITHNRFRPFYSVGISGNFFLKKTIEFNRSVYMNNTIVEEDEFELDIPNFSLGATWDAGCRYLINANHSISIGVNWNGLIIKNQSTTPYKTTKSWRFYFTFNF